MCATSPHTLPHTHPPTYPSWWGHIHWSAVVSDETAGVQDGQNEVRRCVLHIQSSTELPHGVVGKVHIWSIMKQHLHAWMHVRVEGGKVHALIQICVCVGFHKVSPWPQKEILHFMLDLQGFFLTWPCHLQRRPHFFQRWPDLWRPFWKRADWCHLLGCCRKCCFHKVRAALDTLSQL